MKGKVKIDRTSLHQMSLFRPLRALLTVWVVGTTVLTTWLRCPFSSLHFVCQTKKLCAHALGLDNPSPASENYVGYQLLGVDFD